LFGKGNKAVPLAVNDMRKKIRDPNLLQAGGQRYRNGPRKFVRIPKNLFASALQELLQGDSNGVGYRGPFFEHVNPQAFIEVDADVNVETSAPTPM
jgi:hypothetical protein